MNTETYGMSYTFTTAEQRILHNALRDAYCGTNDTKKSDSSPAIFELLRYIDNPNMKRST